MSVPLAVWRSGRSQTLRRWLASEQPDGRQQLTITAYYRKGAATQALASVRMLVSEAGSLGQVARVIVAPVADSRDEETLVSLAYDQSPAMAAPALAQGLRYHTDHPSVGNLP